MTDVTIWSGEPCELGEGPLTHHLRNSLVWCDINRRAIYERPFLAAADDGEARSCILDVMPSAAGIVDASTILLATETDFRFLNLDTWEQTVHLEFAEDPKLRSNDGRVHPSGAFWIGTMAKEAQSPGDIWRLLDGKLDKLVENVRIPNSICFAADGSFAYYTDTPTRTIMRVPTDPHDGSIVAPAEPFVTFEADFPGGPDGSVTDASGNLWNARWGGSAVDVYAPDGARIATHELPVRQPTCPSWIGSSLDGVVTSTARAGLADAREAEGTVLQIHTPVRGQPEPIVRP